MTPSVGKKLQRLQLLFASEDGLKSTTHYIRLWLRIKLKWVRWAGKESYASSGKAHLGACSSGTVQGRKGMDDGREPRVHGSRC